MSLRELIHANPPADKKETLAFGRMCGHWASFNKELRDMDIEAVLRLLNYMLHHRYNSTTLINRALQRFNMLNKATLEDVR